jgi:hypothetical protein
MRRRGAEVLEAALVFPILLALAFGTVEFGYYFYTEHNLTCAAREGARAAVPSSVQSGDRSNVTETAVANVMTQAGIPANQYNVEHYQDGNYWVVKVQMHWSGVNAGLRPLRMCHPAGDIVEGAATMRIENSPSDTRTSAREAPTRRNAEERGGTRSEENCGRAGEVALG